jgi:hypothetical protein
MFSIPILAFIGAAFLRSFNNPVAEKQSKLADDAQIKRGEYLVALWAVPTATPLRK